MCVIVNTLYKGGGGGDDNLVVPFFLAKCGSLVPTGSTAVVLSTL